MIGAFARSNQVGRAGESQADDGNLRHEHSCYMVDVLMVGYSRVMVEIGMSPRRKPQITSGERTIRDQIVFIGGTATTLAQ